MKPKVFRPKAAIAALATIATLCGAWDSSARTARQGQEAEIRREMELAKRDFRERRFDSAEEHLKMALALDANSSEAKMGLAVVYAFQYIPAAPGPENAITWQKAVDAFQDVLANDPNNAVALKSLGALHFEAQKYSEAREFYLTAASANPDDADAYYEVGVTDWSAAYEDAAKRKSEAGLDTDAAFRDTPRDQKNCMDLKAANESRVDDGIKNLSLAMEKRQDFGDAMSYMSLLYQRNAEIECGNPSARAEDLKLSRKFASDALEARNRAQQKAAQSWGAGRGTEQHSDDVDFSKFAEMLLLHIPPPPPPPPPPPVPEGNGQSETAGDRTAAQSPENRLRIPPTDMEKNLINRVEPVYPSIAKAAHVQGDVTLRVIVGKDGRVESVQPVTGSPLLLQAAMDAVKQWVFKAFLQNGEPVEAESTLTIRFQLQ